MWAVMPTLKIWQRIAIIFLLMLAANAVCLVLLNSEKDMSIDAIERERSGLEYLGPLRQIRQSLPEYRQLESGRNLVDRATNPAWLQNIDKAMTELDRLDRKYEHELSTTEDFMALKKDWAELQNAVPNSEPRQQAYTKLNGRMKALIALVGDSSGLMLDNALNSFYLITTVVVDLPTTVELLSNLRYSDGKDNALVLAATLQKDLDDTSSHLKVAMDADRELAFLDMPKRDYEAKVLSLLADIKREGINPNSPLIEGAIEANFQLYDAVTPSLNRILEQRNAGLRANKNEVISLILLLSLSGLIATVWIARGLIGPIHRAIQALEAPGGADVSFSSTNQDEISELIRAATARNPSFQAKPTPSSASTDLVRENQELKLLVAELTLENRTLAKSRSAEASTH